VREQQLLIGLRLRVPREDQPLGRRSWEVDIEHLDRRELLQDLPHCQAGGAVSQVGLQVV